MATAAEVGSCWRESAVVDGEAKVDGGVALGDTLLADGLKELGAVTEEKLWGGCGIPEDIAEAAEGYGEEVRGLVGGAAGAGGRAAGLAGVDGVPVGGEGLGGSGAEAFEAGGAGGEGAGVEGVEGEGRAGGEGRG